MKHTFLSGSLHLMAALSIFCGLGLVGFGAPMYASVSSDGMALMERVIPPEVTLHAPDPSVGPYVAAEGAIQLMLGILLIVLGFFIHGLGRMRDERPVHITVKPAKRKHAWYWMEMSIR